MTKTIAAILCAVGFLCVALSGALTGLAYVFFDSNQYTALQDELNVYERVGLSRADQALVNADLAGYLAGSADTLNREVTLNGEVVSCAFNERELAHMRDVKRLFAFGLMARRVLAAGGIILLITPLFFRPLPRWAYRAGVIGCVAAVAVLGAFAWLIVRLMGFNGLFIRFHELIFTNDLWLLDPATDAMIRMFPEAFFQNMAMRGAVSAAGYALAVLAFTWGLFELAVRGLRRRAERKP